MGINISTFVTPMDPNSSKYTYQKYERQVPRNHELLKEFTSSFWMRQELQLCLTFPENVILEKYDSGWSTFKGVEAVGILKENSPPCYWNKIVVEAVALSNLFPNLKTNFGWKTFGSNKAVILAVVGRFAVILGGIHLLQKRWTGSWSEDRLGSSELPGQVVFTKLK